MISTFALALLGPWSYSGFLAEPTPPPASAVVAPAEKPARPAGPSLPPAPTPTATPPAPEGRPRAGAPPTPTAPTVYRLVDASGQAWDHADPAFLSRFVDARNRASAIPTLINVPPPPARAPRCPDGRCR